MGWRDINALAKGAAMAAVLCFSACAIPVPDLEARVSPEARNAPFPALVDLRPTLRATQDLLPDRVAQNGQSLAVRAADLRRRAAALRAVPQN
ncbi:MAG: hypothetical protein AAFQ06_01990 [Pseudomonadota bacterium]